MDQNFPKKQNSPRISFKPITEGLGFHPFSDGLPYAPVANKNPSSTTPTTVTGAVAAGPPRMASYSKTVPRVSVPVASRIQEEMIKSMIRTHIEDKAHQSEKKGSSLTSSSAASMAWTPGWSYIAKRVAAYLLDSGVNAIFFITVLSRTVWRGNFKFDVLLDPNVLLVASAFFILLNWVLITLQEMTFGTSLAKRAFGLTLRGSAVALFLRALFFIPSASFFGIGLFWGLFDNKKRCWHDRVIGIQPTVT